MKNASDRGTVVILRNAVKYGESELFLPRWKAGQDTARIPAGKRPPALCVSALGISWSVPQTTATDRQV